MILFEEGRRESRVRDPVGVKMLSEDPSWEVSVLHYRGKIKLNSLSASSHHTISQNFANISLFNRHCKSCTSEKSSNFAGFPLLARCAQNWDSRVRLRVQIYSWSSKSCGLFRAFIEPNLIWVTNLCKIQYYIFICLK